MKTIRYDSALKKAIVNASIYFRNITNQPIPTTVSDYQAEIEFLNSHLAGYRCRLYAEDPNFDLFIEFDSPEDEEIFILKWS